MQNGVRSELICRIAFSKPWESVSVLVCWCVGVLDMKVDRLS